MLKIVLCFYLLLLALAWIQLAKQLSNSVIFKCAVYRHMGRKIPVFNDRKKRPRPFDYRLALLYHGNYDLISLTIAGDCHNCSTKFRQERVPLEKVGALMGGLSIDCPTCSAKMYLSDRNLGGVSTYRAAVPCVKKRPRLTRG